MRAAPSLEVDRYHGPHGILLYRCPSILQWVTQRPCQAGVPAFNLAAPLLRSCSVACHPTPARPLSAAIVQRRLPTMPERLDSFPVHQRFTAFLPVFMARRRLARSMQ
jgi:hypothetical protein